MKQGLIILIGIHGLIHLFGFLKAYGISKFSGIDQPISKLSGLFWLLAFLLFFVTIILLLIRSDYWWVCGFLGLFTSQTLIFIYWSDARYGTIANLIILLPAILAYSNHNFKNSIKKERIALFNSSKAASTVNVTKDDISDLPPIVQKWLTNSGIIGKPRVSNVYLIQELQLKLKPEQTEWNKGIAEQYFTITPPAFNWNINTELNPLLGISGRDKFEDGKGEMLIKLLSLVPVADAKNNEKINQAALQRYLAEIVWFPSASLSKYIHWESLDDISAKATMEFNGTKGSGVYYFDNDGQFKKFTALRYKDTNDTEPTEWTVSAQKITELNGIKIPTECDASWQLENEKWTWLKLEIKHIEYNIEKMPVTNNRSTPSENSQL
ncbi:MAG: hypothetical protein CL840_21100 [Crocinitomicaceae bacterium]|nr:hypothetical protein [Crocinitomicaceae bacterium]